MNTQVKISLILMAFGFVILGTSFAATAPSTRTSVNTSQYGTTPQSSVAYPMPTTTPTTRCPLHKVYQTNLNSTQTQVTLASINTDRQTPDPYGGFILFVMGSGGNTMGASCSDPNYPYLCGFDERWIMGLGSGGPRLYYRCCAPPKPTMSMNYSDISSTDCQ